MKDYTLVVDLDVTVQEFFELFFSDESKEWKIKFHTIRGDKDIVVGEWKTIGPNIYERKIKFYTPTSDNAVIKKIAGAGIEIEETQTYTYNAKNELIIGVNTKTQAPYLNEMRTEVKYTISNKAKNPPKCTVSILVTTECRMESLPFWLRSFAGTIESFAHDSCVKSFDVQMNLMKETVAEQTLKRKAQTLTASVPLSSEALIPLPSSKASIQQSNNNNNIKQHTLPTTSSSLAPPKRSIVSSPYQSGEEDDDDDEFFDPMSDEEYERENAAPTIILQGKSSKQIPLSAPNTTIVLNPPPASSNEAKGPILEYLKDMNRDMEYMRGTLETTSSRLATLEKSFTQVSNSQQQQQLSNNNKGASLSDSALQSRLNQYFHQLESLNQQRIEDEKRREEAINMRLELLEKSINRMVIPSLTWGKRAGVFFFVVVWPWVAMKCWNASKYLVIEKLLKKD